MVSSPPFLRDLLVSLGSGLTCSFLTRSVADLLTAVWSVTICLPNWRTSLDLACFSASLPASMSTWFAVTTICAICGSLGPDWAWATQVPAAASTAMRVGTTRMELSLGLVEPWMSRAARAFPRPMAGGAGRSGAHAGLVRLEGRRRGSLGGRLFRPLGGHALREDAPE